MDDYPDWWIMVKGGDVDVYFTSSIWVMADVCMWDFRFRKAVSSGDLKVVGHKSLTRNTSSWMEDSVFAGIAPASEI